MKRGRNLLPPPRPHWRGLMASVTWEEMQQIARLVGYLPHEGQLQIHHCRKPFRVIPCGRRFGKTELSAFELVVCAALGGWAMAAAPTYDLADVQFQRALSMMLESPLRDIIHDVKIAKGNQEIITKSGGLIKARSTENPRSLVARGWDFISYDECAKEDDPEVWHRYMVPGLIDREGAAIFPSTPEGQNWFKELFERGVEGEPLYGSFSMPTMANPMWNEQYIATMADGMTELDYQQEILAQFIDAVGAVFRGYREIATAPWQDEPIPGHRYAIGCDLAKHADWHVEVIFDITARSVAHIIRFNKVDYVDQENELVANSRKWNHAPILIDATNNEGTWEHVAQRVTWATVDGFKFNNLNKEEVTNEFSIGISQKVFELLDPQPAMAIVSEPAKLARLALSEIGSYKYQRLPSGALRMSAPEGKHDDIVTAHVLAYECARRSVGGRPAVIPRTETGNRPAMAGRFVQAAPGPGQRKLRRR